MATDPVCMTAIEPLKAAASVVYRGIDYYFCSEVCHKAFTVHPQRYASGKPVKGHTHGQGPGYA